MVVVTEVQLAFFAGELLGNICKCSCHREGVMTLRHFMPCCDFTYEEYICICGEIDMVKFNRLPEKYNAEVAE